MIKNNKGFTLFNLILIVVAISLMGTVAVQLLTRSTTEARIQQTIKKVQDLQSAIYGNPDLYATGQRSFVTDMGRLPVSLGELTTNTQNDTNWNGPYYQSGLWGEDNVNTDGWGNPLQYNSQTGGISVDSASLAGSIGSVIVADSIKPQFGNIEGNLVDITGEAYRRPGNRFLILIYLEFLGSHLTPIVQDIDKDTEVFRAFWFTEWYRRVYGDDPADDNFNSARHKWYWGWYWWKNFGRSHFWPDDQWDSSRWQFKDMYGHLNFGFQTYWDWVRQRSEQILSTIIAVRPDSVGTFHFTHIPVGNYIITAYDYKLLIPTNSFSEDWVDNGQSDDDDSDFNNGGNDDDGGHRGEGGWWRHHRNDWQWGWNFRPGHGWVWGWHRSGQGWIERKLYRYTIERTALKRYVRVKEGQTAQASFRFNGYFIGNQPWFWVDSSGAGGGGGGEENQEKDKLRVNIQNLRISGKNYNNLTLGNNSTSAITIDKVKVSWSGGGTSRLDNVSIGGNSCWPGGSNKQSGELVDIQNKQLNANSNNISFALHWSNSWASGEDVQLVFTMGDGSERVINSAGDGN